jgi:hypothetical protein
VQPPESEGGVARSPSSSATSRRRAHDSDAKVGGDLPDVLDEVPARPHCATPRQKSTAIASWDTTTLAIVMAGSLRSCRTGRILDAGRTHDRLLPEADPNIPSAVRPIGKARQAQAAHSDGSRNTRGGAGPEPRCPITCTPNMAAACPLSPGSGHLHGPWIVAPMARARRPKGPAVTAALDDWFQRPLVQKRRVGFESDLAAAANPGCFEMSSTLTTVRSLNTQRATAVHWGRW